MVVSGAPKQTSFDRGVARELVVVLTASDNMAAYRCNANNEAKKTVTAQTRLRVYCESDSTLQSTTPEFCVFYLSNPRPRSHSNRFEDHCQTDGAPPRADADSGVQLSNQQPQGQHLLEFRDQQVCLAEMLGFCGISPIVSSLNGVLCPRLEGVEQATNSAPYGGVSVRSELALNLTSQHHKQRVICQAYSPVLGDGTNTLFQLDVRCESENRTFISSLPFLASSW